MAQSYFLTSASLCLLARSSCVGECGLLAGAAWGSSRPFGSSLGLLAAVGCSLPLKTVLMEALAGGEGGFALPEASVESKKAP